MTEQDKERIEEAYSTTYRSPIRRLIAEADTDECQRQKIDLELEVEHLKHRNWWERLWNK